jgi:hypothetical protein
MAKKLFDLVRERSDALGWPKAVLLLIADHAANEDGTGAFPRLETLALELGVEERTVRRAVGELERLGELEVTRGYDHARNKRAVEESSNSVDRR